MSRAARECTARYWVAREDKEGLLTSRADSVAKAGIVFNAIPPDVELESRLVGLWHGRDDWTPGLGGGVRRVFSDALGRDAKVNIRWHPL